MTTSRVIILSGPSGVGKTSIIKGLLERRKDVRLSVSTTTRPRREGENEGRDYHFADDVEFEASIANGAFMEWANSYDHYYGTRSREIDSILSFGAHALLDIDTQGAIQIQDRFEGAIYVFITPPSMAELESRLRGRGTESGEVLNKRLARAEREIILSERYDYILVNHEVGQVIDELTAIIEKEENRAVAFKKREDYEEGNDLGKAGSITDSAVAKATRYAMKQVDEDALVQSLEAEVRLPLRAELEALIRERLDHILRHQLMEIVEDTYREIVAAK